MTSPIGATRTLLPDGSYLTSTGQIVDVAGAAVAMSSEQARAIAAEAAERVRAPSALNPVFSGPLTASGGLGLNGVVAVGKAAAIPSPASDAAGSKTAIDAIRAVLTAVGLTA
jgi:hypothetical protein